MYTLAPVKSLSLALLLGVLATGSLQPALGTAAKAGAAHRGAALHSSGPATTTTMWVSPLDFLPGDPSVQTTFNAVSSGVGSGLSGLVVSSSTLGDTATGGGNKVIEQGLEVPPDYQVTSVRLCYELSNPGSYISQVRIAQVQNPPGSAAVLLDDATPLNSTGPVCVTSQATVIDPSKGGLLLSLRVTFASTSDRIVIRAVGLNISKRPNGSVMWLNPLALLPGDASVQTSFNAVNSGIGSGLSGLVIGSSTVGDTAASGGNKVVEEGISVPPGYQIKAVRLCYELSNPRSYISQIRLAQIQNPPSSARVMLDDATAQISAGPVCVDSQGTAIDPSLGGLQLSLRVHFADTSDHIVVRALGLYLGR